MHNDEPLVKDNSKRSLVLLMPLSQTQNEHKKPKEIVQKTKRCDTRHRKNKLMLLSAKKDSNRKRTTDKNINVEISKQNSDDHIVNKAKYSQENSDTSKRMVDDTYEDKMLLRALKDNLNVEDVIVNLKSQEKTKKCNSEKYICHCKEDDSFSSSSEESFSKMLSSSKTDKPERANHQRLIKYKNTKPDILQQKLYHESPYKLPFPNLIDYFAVQPYQENLNYIPPVPIIYEITPNVSPHMIGNEKKYVGMPFTSFEDTPNYLGENSQYQPIHQKPYLCSSVTEKPQIENSISVTSPSTNYIDASTNKETTNDLESNNSIAITKEDQEGSTKLTTETLNSDARSVHSETETNLYLNYPTNVNKESNTISPVDLDKVVHKSEDYAEQTEKNPNNNLSDYVGISSTPSIIFDETNDGKFISMKECIQLFGRDVCVLSATSPRKFAKPAQNNNPEKYPIRIPEYVTQMSTKQETTLSSTNYADKFKTSDQRNSASETSTKSNADEASLLDSHPQSIEQISKPDVNYKDKSFSIVKNAHIPIKKLMDPKIDETTKTEKNKLLGKSKSHTTKLVLNSNAEEIANSTTDERFLHPTPLYDSNNNKEVNNLKINQQNRVTNGNSNSNTFQIEETTVINYDSKTNFKEKEEKEIIGIGANTHSGDISQEQPTTMQYFNDKKSSNLNNKDTTSNLETIIDSSTSRLPFCDNTLLLNSIRKVINDFALDPRLTKTNNFDEDMLQTQGKNLLPEILQIPHLKNILSIPRIESTIVEKVKDILSHVTDIPRKDFTNDWSHGVIKNTLHSILDALSGFQHNLPPMTFEEHQFKDGQWKTNLVTLAPISDQKLSLATPKNLQESIKDLLSSSAIASQIDHHIVRNMIVQSVKNSLTNKYDTIDDSIIHTLNDILHTLKDSENTNALEKSNEVISNEEDTDAIMQEMPISRKEINADNSTLKGKQNLDIKKGEKMDNKKIQTTDYQKTKILENNENILTTSEFPYLLHKEKEKDTTNKAKIKEHIRDQTLKKIKKIEDDAEKKAESPLKPKITYHKAILQNNPSVLTTFDNNFDTKEYSTETEEYIKNHHVDKESDKNTINLMQETSPNYVQVTNDDITDMVGMNVKEEVKHKNEKPMVTSTDGIDPLIILERIKFNLPPTKYYSPEILKYSTNRIDDKNEITTASTNYVQETPFNYEQLSEGTILQNVAKTRNDGDKMKSPLTTTFNNLISPTNIESTDYKPKLTSLTDKNILESQQHNFTDDNIIKIHEVTTEVQKTYAKTTYFKAGPSSDSPRINSPSLTYETTDIHVNNNNNENNNSNSGNNNNKLIAGNKISNTDNKAKEMIVSSSKSFATDDISPPQFPSTASDDIAELQRSQLYYVSDGMKLPLEIKRLEDGSHALSISKNICQQLLTRQCPCCVPLQGQIIQSLKSHQQEDMHPMTSTTAEKKNQENVFENNIKRDYKPFNTIITRRNTLKESKKEEQEETNAHHLRKQNDDNPIIISMPVIDFARKYNLLLNFNEKGILFNKAELQNKIQNYDKSLIKEHEHDQTEEKNLNNYLNVKKNRLLENNDAIDQFQDLINVREKKNIPNFSMFPITQQMSNLGKNSREFEVLKANAEMNQSQIDQKLKLREVETVNDIQNMNIVQETNLENQTKINPILQGINNPENFKIDKEINWDKLSNIEEGNTRLLHKKENREEAESINNEYVSEVKNFKENIGKSYRHQRNTNNVPNKRTELIKSMLYWLKDLFVDK
ncbi:uncharacterized protein MAL13P1.304 isoform X2 [Monomorium pharaonis]|nr:uncharacterized protein MAL13P1.304 isoform X2 [Monomorium pharaonis]